MKLRIFLSVAFILLASSAMNAQVMLTEAAPNVTIDFSASMQTTVGTNPSSAYKAAGFSPNPTIAGRLNSNAWDVRGFDFGALGFGGTQTVDDYGRGQITSPVLTGGLYAYTELPGSVANPAFMIQPTDTDFNPGSIVLKLKNNGTSNLTQLTVSYNLFIRNDEGRASSFNFSHSSDDVVYQDEPSLDYISPEAPDAFQWTAVDVSPARSIIITGINIAPGGFYYLRWTSQDVSGTGDRDEFGLDDIQISAYYGAASPEINVKGVSGVTILTGDTTPTVAEGTDLAPIGSPLSTVGASLNTTFQIQNLGGALLNVSNITITGPQAVDFSIYIPAANNPPTGDILPAGSGNNYRELTIKFDPSDEGLRKARVTIYNTDSNEGVYWFDVQGYGLIPKPDINVRGLTGGTANITSGNMIPVAGNNTLWVADQAVGTGVTKDYRIQNTGNIASILQLNGTPKVQIGGANPGDFVVTTQPTATNINGGFASNFVITFTPQAIGIRTALVTIPNNDPINDAFTGLPEAPYTFLIQGKGVSPEIDITGNAQPVASGSTTPTLINHTFFDYLNITGATIDRTYTVKNTGTVAMTIGALTITGADASEFSIISLPASTLAINASTTFTIRFDPSSVGIKNAVVNLVNNDFDENPYTFAIRGYGLDYVPCAYGAIETIATQDFETAPAAPAWAYSGSGYSVGAGVGYAATGDGGTSSRFIGGRSLQVINATSSVTFAAANTLLYSDIELSFRLASMSTSTTDGSDNTDKVVVAVSSNGGLTWSNELDVTGNTNAKWSFTSGTGTITATYDGNNVVTSYPIATAGYVTANGMSTIRLASLPKSANLMVRITLINNSAAEIWAIDNVTLFGRKEVTTTWNGSWSNGAPSQTTKAIFDADYNTSMGNITACKCQVNAGKTITVGSGQYISSESDIENAGSIVIQDGGSLVQRNDFAANIGNVTVRRNSTPMRLYDYTYWSSPVGGQTLYNLSPNTRFDKYFIFNTQANNWQSLPSASIMTPGIGYMVRSPQNFTSTPQVYVANFVGSPNNGFVTPPVYNTVGDWNLVGNPYPSAINADAFLQLPANSALLNGTIYFWTHNTPITNQNYSYNDYAVYNLLGGTGTMAAPNIGVNNTVPNGKIASGQGFFVLSHTPGTITFNNSMRITGNNTTFFRPSLQGHRNNTANLPGDIEKHRLWLDLYNNSGLFSQTLVGYADGASNGVDMLFDGPFANAGNSLSFYSLLDEGQDPFAIQGRALPFNASDTVKLGFVATAAGNYTIGLEGFDGLFENQGIYLEDKALNLIHDLKESAYAFTTTAGTFDTRFELRFTTEQLAVPDASLQNSLTAVVSDHAIHLKSRGSEIESVAVFDLLGRNLYQSSDIHAAEFTIRNVTANQQSLIVKSKLANGAVVSTKILY